MPADTPRSSSHLSALRGACYKAGLRLDSSRGQITVHRLGYSVTVLLHLDGKARWEVPACARTGMDPVHAMAGSERPLAAHLAYRLESLARRRAA